MLSACSVELQHDLTENDANDIYVLLQRNGINASKDKDETGGNEIRYKITTAKGDVASAAQLLRDYSLPKPKSEGLHGLFAKNKGMIPTATEEKARCTQEAHGRRGRERAQQDTRRARGERHRRAARRERSHPARQRAAAAVGVGDDQVPHRPAEQKGPPLDEKTVQKFVAYGVPKCSCPTASPCSSPRPRSPRPR